MKEQAFSNIASAFAIATLIFLMIVGVHTDNALAMIGGFACLVANIFTALHFHKHQQ